VAEIMAVFWAADPQTINSYNSDPKKAQKESLSYRVLKSVAWLGCGRVEEIKNTYIFIM